MTKLATAARSNGLPIPTPTSTINRLPAHLSASLRDLDLSRFQRIILADDPDPDLATSGLYLVQITPDRAAAWWELNDNIRRLTPNHAQYLARQISEDKWEPRLGASFKFKAVTGRLADGQHRLWAIVESGKTVFAQVETGVPEEVLKYVDSGMTRRLHHQIQFTGDPGADRTLGSIITSWTNVRATSKSKMAPDRALAMYRDHQRALDWILTQVNKRLTGASRPAVLAGLCEYYERHPDLARPFAECLFDRESVAVQPAVYLRQRLAEMTGKKTRIEQDDQFQMVIGACCAHLEGRPVNSLKKRDW